MKELIKNILDDFYCNINKNNCYEQCQFLMNWGTNGWHCKFFSDERFKHMPVRLQEGSKGYAMRCSECVKAEMEYNSWHTWKEILKELIHSVKGWWCKNWWWFPSREFGEFPATCDICGKRVGFGDAFHMRRSHAEVYHNTGLKSWLPKFAFRWLLKIFK
jgi:hypothetical protein